VPHVAFSALSSAEVVALAKVVKELGGKVVETVDEASHLVSDRFLRTVKFLAAINKGAHVATSLWLQESKKSGGFLDADEHMLNDKKAEEELRFSLVASLRKARAENPVFHGHAFYLTKGIKPSPADLKSIIVLGGGRVLTSVTAAKADPKCLVISCAADKEEFAPFKAFGHRIFTPELVLAASLRQTLVLEDNMLST
jgi:PAX-interacting protein 1